MKPYRNYHTRSSLGRKSSSLYFLNDISNFGSSSTLNSTSHWKDLYTISPDFLGRGHFSKVLKAKSENGNSVAIKVIRRKRRGKDHLEEIMKEIDLLQRFTDSGCSGFIQLLEHHVSVIDVAIVLELASGGSIYEVVYDSKTGLPEVYCKILMIKILSALIFMHNSNIVHLDIKADNILLRQPYPSTDAVICDFGVARQLSEYEIHRELVGTPDYIAPEITNYEPISSKTDMWSMGVLCYFVLTNISPFLTGSREETMSRVTAAVFEYQGILANSENLESARDFISALLQKKPEHRLSAKESLEHGFLAGVPRFSDSQPMDSASPNLRRSSVKSFRLQQQQQQLQDQPSPVKQVSPSVRVRNLENSPDNFHVRCLVTSQYDINVNYNFESLDVKYPKELFDASTVDSVVDKNGYSSQSEHNSDEKKPENQLPHVSQNDQVDTSKTVIEEKIINGDDVLDAADVTSRIEEDTSQAQNGFEINKAKDEFDESSLVIDDSTLLSNNSTVNKSDGHSIDDDGNTSISQEPKSLLISSLTVDPTNTEDISSATFGSNSSIDSETATSSDTSTSVKETRSNHIVLPGDIRGSCDDFPNSLLDNNDVIDKDELQKENKIPINANDKCIIYDLRKGKKREILATITRRSVCEGRDWNGIVMGVNDDIEYSDGQKKIISDNSQSTTISFADKEMIKSLPNLKGIDTDSALTDLISRDSSGGTESKKLHWSKSLRKNTDLPINWSNKQINVKNPSVDKVKMKNSDSYFKQFYHLILSGKSCSDLTDSNRIGYPPKSASIGTKSNTFICSNSKKKRTNKCKCPVS